MNLCIISAHAGADSLSQAVLSWGSDVPLFIIDGSKGMLQAYQQGYIKTPDYDVLAYFHDDTIINDPGWWHRVMAQFDDPHVGVVGFGGALGHGNPEIYKAPYDYKQLARHGFMSNMRNAEDHGTRFAGDRDVAVLDGFALIVRREVLDKCGGWFVGTPVSYIGYDYAICCWAHRLGYKIRLTGVSCDHFGGRTFVAMGIGQDPKHWQSYLDAHAYIYSEFKDVLPWRC